MMPPNDDGVHYAVFDGGILLSEHEKGEVGVFLHVVVGKGGSDKDLDYKGYHA